MKKVIVLVVLIVSVVLAGCSGNANTKEASQVIQQQQNYVDNQPMPAFDWSLERHMFIELYKARNNAIQTYSYVRNLNGQIVFSCVSIGFPIAANTQITNPEAEKIYGDDTVSSSGIILPQAEPNGLYTSPSTAGTYVFCLNADGTVSPSYFEMDVETHLSRLETIDGVSQPSDNPTLKINTKQ